MKKVSISLFLFITVNILSCPEISRAITSDRIQTTVAAYGHWEIQKRIDALKPLYSEATGQVKSECALALGYSELINRQAIQAIPYLEFASGTPWYLQTYSKLLLAKAYFDSGKNLENAVKILDSLKTVNNDSIRHDALHLLVMINDVLGTFDQVIVHSQYFLADWPDDPAGHVVRWKRLAALKIQNRPIEAFQLAEEIYYEYPGSPYLNKAINNIESLQTIEGIQPKKLSSAQHLEFIKTLRQKGHHRQALKEIERFKKRFPTHAKLDEIYVLKAKCHHNLWENSECIETVRKMLQKFPHSNQRDDAMIAAIKSARRVDDADRVERWCIRLIEEYEGKSQALEGMYNLACFMSNYSYYYDSSVKYKQKAEKWFLMLNNHGGNSVWRRHGLWKYAWFLVQIGQHQQAVRYIDILIDEFPSSGYRWPALYWSGRFHVQYNNKQLAYARWKALLKAKPYEYYGQKALQQLRKHNIYPDKIGQNAKFPHIPPFTTKNGNTHHDRALSLKNLGLYEYAASELALELKHSDTLANRFHYCQMLGASGETNKAIRELPGNLKTFISAGGQNVPPEFWEIVYPFHFFPTIIREAVNYDVDPWLVVALIKHESNFDPHAASNVGAIGLMQIMPETARKIAADMNIPTDISKQELYNPELNIRLGVFHIKQLVDTFENNWVPAVCSYNAGAGPVKKWMQTIPMDDIEAWIERIPYHATRIYVKNILSDMSEYRRIYDL